MTEKLDYNPFKDCYSSKKEDFIMKEEEEDFSKTFTFEESEALLNELNNFKGISQELSENMYSEMNQAMSEPANTLIVGTEGTKTFTIITAPESIVGGRGPVLIPTSDPSKVLSMVSKEFVEKMAEMCEEEEDQDEAEVIWRELLGNFFDKTIELSEKNETPLLGVPDFIPEGDF